MLWCVGLGSGCATTSRFADLWYIAYETARHQVWVWWFFEKKAAEAILALSSELNQFWGSREMGVPARVCLARHERAPPKENCQGLSLRGLGSRVQV